MSNSNALPVASCLASIISVLSQMRDASMRETYQYGLDRAMTHPHDHNATLDKVARGCNTPVKIKKEETNDDQSTRSGSLNSRRLGARVHDAGAGGLGRR